MDDSWSNDKTVCYYQGWRMKFIYPLGKALLLGMFGVYLAAETSMQIAGAVCLLIAVYYQNVVASVLGYAVIPSMDYTCFLGGSKSVVNFMNCTYYDTGC